MEIRIINPNYMNEQLYQKGLELYKSGEYKLFGWIAFCLRHDYPIF